MDWDRNKRPHERFNITADYLGDMVGREITKELFSNSIYSVCLSGISANIYIMLSLVQMVSHLQAAQHNQPTHLFFYSCEGVCFEWDFYALRSLCERIVILFFVLHIVVPEGKQC